MTPTLTCTLCGHTFDPTGQEGCRGCPIQPSCQLVRCPACGFEMPDPERSTLVKSLRRFSQFLRPTASIEEPK